MTRRRLTPDEIALWRKVADQAEKLHRTRESGPDRPLPKPKPTRSVALRPSESAMVETFRIGQGAPAMAPTRSDLKSTLPDRLAAAPLRMDRKAFTRMRRGKMRPEGRIDLHGMTLAAAHPALIRFILTAQASGKRLVLVITGKGKTGPDHGPIPTPRGVLKHNVPHWLETPPLAQAIQQVTQAHSSHGGSGAYYVYLRKGR